MDISIRLQNLRKEHGYSQEQVAEMLDISRQAVSKWESGQGKPDFENIVKLTEIYHVSADYILLGTGECTETTTSPKKELCREFRIAIGIILIIAATAAITVLFIFALDMISNITQ